MEAGTPARYKAYPAYKTSGVEWLANIPAGWETIFGKRLFSNRREQALVADEQLAASQAFGVVPQSLMMARNNAKVMLALKGTSSFRHVEKDDFVISLRSFEGGVEHSAYTGCVSPAYTVLQPVRNIEAMFFRYLLKSGQFVSALQSTTDSLRDGKSITFQQFGSILLGLPSLPEQTQISAFLDYETAKIDALIAKQQRLIALLEEKRQAVISHAVTKGLNPTAPLRPSGIDWLGDVPAHWEVKKFSHSTTIRSGQVDPSKAPYSEYTLIAPNHIESATGRLLGIETARDQGADSGKYLCAKGEVIYSKIRPALAKACIAPNDQTICSADMYPIAGTNGLTNKFLLWNLLSQWFTSLTILESDRVAMPKINREKLAEVSIPVPPTEEQEQICDFIADQTNLLDGLLAKAQSAIVLLKERRTALISAAVTGKIDVRDWQPPKSISDQVSDTPKDQSA